jgi:hypothetical protein
MIRKSIMLESEFGLGHQLMIYTNVLVVNCHNMLIVN